MSRELISAVRRNLDFTLSSVKVHPNFLAGIVCGKKASCGSFKLLVVCVYIPPKCSLYSNRAETLEALGSFLVSENKKNGLDDILVMSDWNMTPEEAARFLAVNNLYCTINGYSKHRELQVQQHTVRIDALTTACFRKESGWR
ncbi:hypothetical protein LUQ84_001569 [Hamiltosporidium tvaerminnensis]|nr:hypothetical protein LUQ84_001569 [Hamiltosporidium tvaerminnensis]